MKQLLLLLAIRSISKSLKINQIPQGNATLELLYMEYIDNRYAKQNILHK